MENEAKDIINIPPRVYDLVKESLGQYFSKISLMKPDDLTKDMLNPAKMIHNKQMLSKYVNLEGKKILEVGSGYGTNLVTWIKCFGLDVTGVEPGGEGFSETIKVSKLLCEANGISSDKIVVSNGETIPFSDNSFDIVYSANVLEHTADPVKVLMESIRVLKPSGLLYFEMPNFFCCFEGHYFVFMPPNIFKGFLPWWIKNICGRDPSFARTLHTEINPVWLRRVIRRFSADYPVKIESLGEEVFRDRLKSHDFEFQANTVKNFMAPIMKIIQAPVLRSFIASILIFFKAYYPIYLILKKLDH